MGRYYLDYKPLKLLIGTLLASLSVVSPYAEPITAWQELVATGKGTAMSSLERKVLQVLSPNQAQAYTNGEDPANLLLPSGESLADFLVRIDLEKSEGLRVIPVEPCVLFDLVLAGRSEVFVRRTSRSSCGIAEPVGEVLKTHQVRALIVSLQVTEAQAEGEITLWPGGGAVQPQQATLTFGRGSETDSVPTLILPICDEVSLDPCGDGDLKLAVEGSSARVRLMMHGRLELNHPVSMHTREANQGNSISSGKALGESLWTEGAGNLHYLAGNVGIGTANPLHRLDIWAQDTGGAIIKQTHTIAGYEPYFDFERPTLTLERGSSTRGVTMAMGKSDKKFYLTSTGAGMAIRSPDQDALISLDEQGEISLGLQKTAIVTAGGSFQVFQEGFGGWWPAWPQDHVFRVWGHHPARIEQSNSLGGDGSSAPYFAPSDPTIALLRRSSSRGSTMAIGNEQASFYIYADPQAMRFFAPDGTTAIQTLTPLGNIGLGVSAPVERLEVDGNVKISGDLQLSGRLVSSGDICIGQCG